MAVKKKKTVTRNKVSKKSSSSKKIPIHHKIALALSDKMVIAVMLAAGFSILILLASYISVTGLAVSGTPDTTGLITVFQGAELLSGDGTMKCSYACAREGKYAILSSVDGEQVDNNDVVNGEWTCLCAGTG